MTTATRIKKGTTRADGRLFWSYRKEGEKEREIWITQDAYHRGKLLVMLSHARTRSSNCNLPFDLDIEHLCSIYPSDGICPALGIALSWFGGRTEGSPSLDRIKPNNGYIKGNVAIISDLANRIKSNATTDQVIRVANYLKELNCS